MTIYHLTAVTLSIFLLCLVLLGLSYTPLQSELIDDGSDSAADLLHSTYSRYQKVLVFIGTISFLFTVVHTTIAAAMLVKELM